MADTRLTHTQTFEPRVAADSCHVHGALFDWILSGAETVHYMQHSVPGSCIPDMLQWLWELYILQQQLRFRTV